MDSQPAPETEETSPVAAEPRPAEAARPGTTPPAGEVGGPKGPEPTRYGDWELKGRCIDF